MDSKTFQKIWESAQDNQIITIMTANYVSQFAKSDFKYNISDDCIYISKANGSYKFICELVEVEVVIIRNEYTSLKGGFNNEITTRV